MLPRSVVLCLGAMLAACGGGGGGGSGSEGVSDAGGGDAGVVSAVTYTGTNTATSDVVGIGASGETVTTTTAATVHVMPPMHQEEGGGDEKNPFHFDVEPRPASLQQVGVMFQTTAHNQVNLDPPPVFFVVDDWTFTQDPSTGRIEGRLTYATGPNSRNMIYTKELGGPLPGLDLCAGSMLSGATVKGTIAPQRVDFTIEGEAGGPTLGPTCIEQFHFSAHVVATH